MLLIKFYGNFCSFHRIYILKIGIQLEHEEINWNLELQNPKAEPEAENRELQKAFANFTISQPLRNFVGLQNFAALRKFAGAAN